MAKEPVVATENSQMSGAEHQRKAQKAVDQGRDDERQDVFDGHTDDILGLDEANFITNKTSLHKENKTRTDDDPEVIHSHDLNSSLKTKTLA